MNTYNEIVTKWWI